MATWLQAAGYHTAMIGKYLNRYVPETDGVPPGWDDWYVGGNAHASYDYTLNENGRIVRLRHASREDYLNDVLTRKAVGVIRGVGRGRRAVLPLRAALHAAQPVGRGAAPRGPVRATPSCRARRPSTRPTSATSRPSSAACRRSTSEQIAWLEDEYRAAPARRCRRSTTWSRRIVGALEATGQLDETYVIYTSDNGFHMGEHRLIAGKDTPYEEDIRVPMIMRGPGVPGGRADRRHGRSTSTSRRPSPRSPASSRPASSTAARCCRCSTTRTSPGGRAS